MKEITIKTKNKTKKTEQNRQIEKYKVLLL